MRFNRIASSQIPHHYHIISACGLALSLYSVICREARKPTLAKLAKIMKVLKCGVLKEQTGENYGSSLFSSRGG
jgi:hypothetical protein